MTPRVPTWLLERLRRPAAILGGGVSGRAAAGLLQALGGGVTIYDQAAGPDRPAHFDTSLAAGHDLVVLSPGFPPEHPWVRSAHAAGCLVLGELDLGALAWPGEIIAVTGTNGKTTLTELLAHALRSVGRDARAVGNVGHAFCEAWKAPAGSGSVAVCEVSSFQAEQLQFFEARSTLWSNFAEDHLERHPSLEAYFLAKYRLVRHTRGGDVTFGPSVLAYARLLGLPEPPGPLVDFSRPVGPGLEGTVFARLPQRDNYLLARAFWLGRGLPEDALAAAARSFVLGAHRLARVREVAGVTYWNDSKATNFHAAEAALAGFAAPVLWIGGGRAKGGDMQSFATRIAPRIRIAFLIGETAVELERYLQGRGVPTVRCASLHDAVIRAQAASREGDDVLLSPGFASFDMFSGYGDRGSRFESLVASLPPAPPKHSDSIQPNPIDRPVLPGLCPP